MNSDILDNLKFDIINSYNITDALQAKFFDLIKKQPNSFYGRDDQSHITSSVLVIDQQHQNVLLTHHKKFDKWLQLGGHWMDHPGVQETVFSGGIREVFEEAYGNKPVEYLALNEQLPLNIDVHPAGKDIHYDICYLVEIDSKIPFVISDESENLAWVSIDEILNNSSKFENRLQTMVNDARQICSKQQKKIKP